MDGFRERARERALARFLKYTAPAHSNLCNEKNRFYRMAKRSATECAGILDVCKHLNLIKGERIIKARELLLRIVSMLTKMVRASSKAGQGHAHGHVHENHPQ